MCAERQPPPSRCERGSGRSGGHRPCRLQDLTIETGESLNHGPSRLAPHVPGARPHIVQLASDAIDQLVEARVDTAAGPRRREAQQRALEMLRQRLAALRRARVRLTTADWRLPTGDCRLLTADCGLPTAD